MVCLLRHRNAGFLVLWVSRHWTIHLVTEQQMGKKAKKSTKQAWKKSQAAQEYEESMKVVKDGEKLTQEASENLFYIDTNGRSEFAVGRGRFRPSPSTRIRRRVGRTHSEGGEA